MKPGDMIALRPNRVVVQLLSDDLENSSNTKKVHFGSTNDTRTFRRGDSGIVLEINETNLARVKILYKSGAWWANASDFMVMG